MTGPSILNGVDAIVDTWLGVNHIGSAPHYRHRRAQQVVSSRAAVLSDPAVFIGDLLATIERNWTLSRASSNTRPSAENWRFLKRLDIAERNTSPEVTLERRIAAVTGDEWANQMPTASGLTGLAFDRHRHVDLVQRQSEDAYTFYELKVAADTPLFAAIEIVLRGLLYLFARRHLGDLGYTLQAKPLLGARRVQLRVLAPAAFYGGANLRWLETALNDGFRQLLTNAADGDIAMDFALLAFPPAFVWPCSDAELQHALDQLGRI